MVPTQGHQPKQPGETFPCLQKGSYSALIQEQSKQAEGTHGKYFVISSELTLNRIKQVEQSATPDSEQVLTLRSCRLQAITTLRSITVQILVEGFRVPTKNCPLPSEHICKSPI